MSAEVRTAAEPAFPLVAVVSSYPLLAEALDISEFTVKRHMQNILQKLDVPSRRAAAAFYVSAYREEATA